MSSKNAPINPMRAKRAILFKEMPEELQEVAREVKAIQLELARGMLRRCYRLGVTVLKLIDNEATYGWSAVEQLAECLGLIPSDLYAFRDLVLTWPTDAGLAYLLRWTEQEMANGDHLQPSHWLLLRKVLSPEDRERLISLALENSLTPRQLQAEIFGGDVKTLGIRQGKRKPSRPTSPMSGVLQFKRKLELALKYQETLERAVCDRIDEASPDDINPLTLKQLQELRDVIKKAGEMLPNADQRLGGNIERVERVLRKNAKKAQKTPDDESENDPG